VKVCGDDGDDLGQVVGGSFVLEEGGGAGAGARASVFEGTVVAVVGFDVWDE